MDMSFNASIKELEEVSRRYVNKAAVDQALLDYNNWVLALRGEKKEVVHLLYFLKALEERSGNQALKNEKKISEIILSKVEPPNLERRKVEEKDYCTLLGKEIGSKYQIEMKFQDPKGLRFTKGINELGI